MGRDGAVPAAGRVQGAGAESPAHSAPAEAADRVEIFSWFEIGIVQSSADESRASAGHLLGCTFVRKVGNISL